MFPLRFYVTAVTALFSTVAFAGTIHALDFPQDKNAPNEVVSVVEIPAGSNIKFELDDKTGLIYVDRFQSMPVAYPSNYGSIVRTLGEDGDPLDVLIYTRSPVPPGVLIKVRPIGVMRMVDGGEVDDKIIAVPTSKVDPTYDNIKNAADLPQIEQDRILAFFRVYKQLPASRKVVEVKPLEGADAAKSIIQDALKRYVAKLGTGK